MQAKASLRFPWQWGSLRVLHERHTILDVIKVKQCKTSPCKHCNPADKILKSYKKSVIIYNMYENDQCKFLRCSKSSKKHTSNITQEDIRSEIL